MPPAPTRLRLLALAGLAGALAGGPAARAGGLKLGATGRLHVDTWDYQRAPDLTEPRRARLGVTGRKGRFDLKFEWDNADNRVGLRDGYLAWRTDAGIFIAGHQKEFFGLEQWASTNSATFIERATPDIFTPARNTGLSYRHIPPGGKAVWGIGVFEERDGRAHQVTDPDYGVTGRYVYLPWRPAPDKLLHLGASLSRRNPGGDQLRFRSRPESRFLPNFVDTGAFPATGATHANLEAAWVNGPLSLQGEWFAVDVDSPARGDPRFTGSYLYASLFLTDDHRPYKRSDAAFDKVNPAGRDGAVELGIRYSDLSLTDAGVAGGDTHAWTLGLNYYLTKRLRIQLNWVSASRPGLGDEEMLGARTVLFF